MPEPVPILMPTAPRYLPLAQWTCGQIGRFWPRHPEIFLCGAEGDERCLPLREDPADWMRVAAAACGDLLGRGIRQAYVILDDHPPIAPCHEEFLSATLPLMTRELEATSILAVGFGPLVRRKGAVERWREWNVERLPLREPWKLTLHPALWDLGRLHGILLHLIDHLPQEQHNPWAFERIGSDPSRGKVREDWLSSCWRLDAMQAASPEARRLHDLADRRQRLGRRIRAIAGRLAGKKPPVSALSHPRVGPYPCFWSGVMKKGSLSAEYVEYSHLKKRPELLSGLEDVFRRMKAPEPSL
jgi:hypothetical protein